DVDISGATLVARTAWIWSNATASSGTPALFNNGSTIGITLTTTASLYTNIATSASYPSSASAVGEVGQGSNTTQLFETGMMIAFTPAASGGEYDGSAIRVRMREW